MGELGSVLQRPSWSEGEHIWVGVMVSFGGGREEGGKRYGSGMMSPPWIMPGKV
jgi:hypothetical protein